MKKLHDKRRAILLPLSALLTIIIATVLTVSCQANSISSGSKSSDLKLSFKVLGLSTSTQNSSSATKAVSKLLLSSASSLTVSLTPTDSSLTTPAAQTVAISGSGALTLSATFTDVEYGTYTVKAVASDSSGNAQFQQSGTVTVSASTSAVTLNLVPANPTTVVNLADYVMEGLAAGSVYMMEVPASLLSGGEYYIYYYYGSTDNFTAYALNPDGSLNSSSSYSGGAFSSSSSSIFTITPSSSSGPSYLILYNTSSSNLLGTVYINMTPSF